MICLSIDKLLFYSTAVDFAILAFIILCSYGLRIINLITDIGDDDDDDDIVPQIFSKKLKKEIH